MSMRGVHVTTPYVELMRAGIDALVGQGETAFNQDQLAAWMGVKKTTSFYVRLKQFVANGYLETWGYFTEKRGVGTLYGLRMYKQMPLPENEVPF